MADKRRRRGGGQPKSMGEFERYTRPDGNLKKKYEEYPDAGPEERAELLRCHMIDRNCESFGRGYGPADDETYDYNYRAEL